MSALQAAGPAGPLDNFSILGYQCGMKLLSLIVIGLLCRLSALAAIQTEAIEYKQGDTVLEGFLAYDDSIQGKRPGVMVVHQWKGLTDYEKERATMLAEMGYTAFAVDIYGKGIRPKDNQQAGAEAGKYKKNRQLLRARAQAGLEFLQKHDRVDARHIAAIGYCFGGTTVIELARSGAAIAGVVSFHGGLDSPTPEDGKNIKGKVLALHGADDPFVPAKDLAAFEDEMRQAKVDWQLVKYGGAVHSFTERHAGDNNLAGAAYNERADRRSWAAMRQFFDEILK
jgi:dienelactone hydrolase